MLSTGVTAVLGLVFWGLAARLFSTGAVGRASAELSAMALLAQFAQLNLANAFIRLLPQAGIWTRAAVLAGYGVSSVVGVAAVVVFLFTPLSDGVVPSGVGFRLLFSAAVLLWTIFVIQDGVLTGLRQAVWVPVENISFSSLKLILLPVLVVSLPGQGVFWAWTMPVILAVVAVNAYLFLVVLPSRVAAGRQETSLARLPQKRSLASLAAAGYLTGLASALAAFLLPLIIITRLGATANAYFYVPWLFGIVLANLMSNVMASFIVEVSYGDSQFRQLFWRLTRLLVGVTAVSMLVIFVAGVPLLRVLSHGYATAGSSLLRWIALSVPFGVVLFLFQASLWIRGRVWFIVALDCVQTTMLIGITLLLIGTLGINSVGVANLVTQGTLALLTLPAVINWYRQRVNGHNDVSPQPFFDGPAIPA